MTNTEIDLTEVLSRESETELELQYGIELILIAEVGPAGGNPLYGVQGEAADIIKFMKEWYFGPDYCNVDREIESCYPELLETA